MMPPMTTSVTATLRAMQPGDQRRHHRGDDRGRDETIVRVERDELVGGATVGRPAARVPAMKAAHPGDGRGAPERRHHLVRAMRAPVRTPTIRR